jgi:hypothetical protein
LGSLVALLNIPVLQYKFETSLDLSLKSSIALENSNIFPILIDHIWVLPITLCLVYVVAPLQLRLVQPPDFGFSLGQKRDARLAAILAAVASSVLGIVTAILESQLFQHLRLAATFTYPIWTITALINAVPFVFLYVALYLIANPDSPVAVPPSSRAGGDFPT